MFLVDAPTALTPDVLTLDAGAQVERETGFEPATPSLEGWRSTAELFPRVFSVRNPSPQGMVGRGGFEPPTHCLQGSCSTPELRQQSQTLTLGSESSKVKTISLVSRVSGAPLRSRKWPPPRTR